MRETTSMNAVNEYFKIIPVLTDYSLLQIKEKRHRLKPTLLSANITQNIYTQTSLKYVVHSISYFCTGI